MEETETETTEEETTEEEPTTTMEEAAARLMADEGKKEGEQESESPDEDKGDSDEESDDEEKPKEEEKPKLKPLPKPKPKETKPGDRVRNRIQARRRSREELNGQASALEQREAQLKQMEAALNQRAQTFQQASAAGDYDKALQAMGLPPLSEIQRQDLIRKGAISPPDPKLQELEKKLTAYEQREQQILQQRQQQMAQQRAEQERQEVLQELAEEVSLSGYEHAEDLKNIDGFLPMMHEFLESQEGELDIDEALGQTVEVYRELFTRLSPVFGEAPDPAGESQEAPEEAPGQPGGSAGTRRVFRKRRGSSSKPKSKRKLQEPPPEGFTMEEAVKRAARTFGF